MSLYSALFGRNPKADVVLATLGLTRGDVGRFRDCFVADGKIAVYTRNGGGNRECWTEEDKDNCDCPGCTIEVHLPKHPNYLYDEDDDFDCTYATIYFSFPDQWKEELSAMDSGEPFDPSERWIAFLDALKNANPEPRP